MKKYLLILILFVSIPFFINESVRAQPYAECDACGYCQGQEPPDNWADCARCIYPNIADEDYVNDDAKNKETLEIILTPIPDPKNPNNIIVNRPLPPASGKYYTQIGCVNTNLLTFRDNPAAAGDFVNVILNNLLFPIAGALAFGGIVYGAFMLVTAQGEQGKIEQGRKLVTSSIVGIIFTVMSVFIINFIAGSVLRIPGFFEGTKITFVGFGLPTNRDGNIVYPNAKVFYDGEIVGEIGPIKGNSSNPESYDFYLEEKIDVGNEDEVKKIVIALANDACYMATENCGGDGNGGDRNLRNTNLFIEDVLCKQRVLSLDIYDSLNGSTYSPRELVKMNENNDGFTCSQLDL